MLLAAAHRSEFLPGAVLYLKLYALGLPAMGIYNCGNGILSATGDTKRPLLYLTVAGVLNVILNLVFVIGCGMAAEAWLSPAPSHSGVCAAHYHPPAAPQTPAVMDIRAGCGCTTWPPSVCC